MSHVIVLLALLWYALVPAVGLTSAGEGRPSVRGERSAITHAIRGVRSPPRETSREEEAPSPLAPAGAAPVVAPAGSFRRSAPRAERVVAPDPRSSLAVARGPPSR